MLSKQIGTVLAFFKIMHIFNVCFRCVFVLFVIVLNSVVICWVDTDEMLTRGYSHSPIPAWFFFFLNNRLPSLCQLPVPRQTGQVSRQLACSGWRQRPNVYWTILQPQSATANTGALINLNMAHLQASSHRLPLSHLETAFAHRQMLISISTDLFFLIDRCSLCWPNRRNQIYSFSSQLAARESAAFNWGLWKSKDSALSFLLLLKAVIVS